MKTSKLVYKASKKFVQCGKQRVINLTVSLDDDCNNKHHDFSITSMVYEGGKLVGGGCNHEEIVKHFPELKPYIPLHLCGHEGEPSYPVENGIYFFKHEPMLKVMEYMRITEDEYTKLAHHIEDKDYFKYLLFSLGIVARWKKEADEFIKFLEEKTGNEWVNPYSEDEERFRLVLTEEEKAAVLKRIANGDFTDEGIAQRRKEEWDAYKVQAIEEIKKEYNEQVERLNIKRRVMLYILGKGISLKNVMFHDHYNIDKTQKVVFNWKTWAEPVITKDGFDKFVAELDRTIVPESVKFELETNK